jgi:5-methylthioadenosine/S-adenosylhomocysteine deaminase
MTVAADFVVIASWVVPIEPAGALADHAVVVRSGRIQAVLPAAEARRQYAGLRVVELPGQVLLPGLVNLHTHAAMALLRGYADEVVLP